jgi:hypothetical protein
MRERTHVVIHVVGDDRFLGESIGEKVERGRAELTGIWVRYRRKTLATSWVV